MSKQALRVIDLMWRAKNWQNQINAVQEEISRYGDDPGCQRNKAQAEDEARRWSRERDEMIAKLRLLINRLDEHERQHLIERSIHNLGVQMHTIGIELPWWRNRNDPPYLEI